MARTTEEKVRQEYEETPGHSFYPDLFVTIGGVELFCSVFAKLIYCCSIESGSVLVLTLSS